MKLTDEPLCVLADANQLQQVLMNLCTNAVRAMPGGGQLEVRVEAVQVEAPREVTLGALRQTFEMTLVP